VRNPYALPLRLRRQVVTELRQAIASMQEQLAHTIARDAALAAQASVERRWRSSEPCLAADGWFEWQRHGRDALARDIATMEKRLEALRMAVREELGQIGALETAEQRLLAEARRRADRRAQAVADDRAATLFLAEATA